VLQQSATMHIMRENDKGGKSAKSLHTYIQYGYT